MTKIRLGLFVLTLAAFVAVALWRRSLPLENAEALAQPVPNQHGRAVPSAEAASLPSASASGAATTSAADSLPRPWGELLSSEGRPLDPRQTHAPDAGAVAVGRVATFAAGSLSLDQMQQGQEIVIPLPGGFEARGVVNLKQIDAAGTVRLGGGLTGGSIGSFSLGQNQGQIGGRVLLRQQKLAYLIATLATGEVSIREVALSDVICDPYPLEEASESDTHPLRVEPEAAPPELRSRPDAAAVLYLDFDGATVTDPDWNDGNTIEAAASTLNNSQITEVWERVKEDFWPFDINVTTREADYSAAAVGRRMRVIITPTDSWYSNAAGGVAYRDSFAAAGTLDFSNDVPCWVFNSYVESVVEAISHELGHTLGLRHDGRTLPEEEYYSGHGHSPSWGPIMGASYYVRVTQWSKGEYPSANNQEDDIAVISGQQVTALYGLTNNTGFVVDDAGDNRAAAVTLDVSNYSISRTGTISTSDDSDYYAFSVGSNRKLTLNVTPSSTYYNHANLDVQVELQDANGTVLLTADPDGQLNASLITTVPAGTYYLRVRGAAHAASGSDYGYTSYGSVGPYTLSGALEDVVAPSITSNPQSQNLYASNSLSLSASAVGTSPLIYQWKKNGTALVNDSRISGATSTSLYIADLAVGDSGSYTMTATNAAGSATTAVSTIVVSLPPAPVFSGNLSNASVVEGNSLYIYSYASSVVNASYQWYKDGLLVPGQTNSTFSKNSVSIADAGDYWVVATNAGGSTTSSTAVVTILPAKLPVITQQPQSADLYTGQYYTLYVSANSNAPMTYQWYRDGVALPNATYSSYYINSASATHVGEYTVALTNPAGTVTSAGATITVSSTLPPRITSQPYSQSYVSVGDSASFSVGAEGTGPLTYQWYRNGAPLVGKTSSYLSLYPVSVADVGEYYVTVSNANGSVQSDVAMLDLNQNNPPETYWYETREFDGVVYFLFKHSGKIARYDLATETWLPAWSLGQAPTAFTISTDAVFVAFGTTIRKYSLALGNPVDLISAPYSVIWLELANGNLLTAGAQGYYDTRFATYNPTTGALIDSKSFTYSAGRGFSYSAVTGKIYGRKVGISPGDICSIEVAANGTIGAVDETPYHGDYPEGMRTFTLNNGTYVTDNGGIIYNANNLTFRASFGFTLKDAVPADTGYCVLTGIRVYRFDQNFQQIGRAIIPIYGERLAYRGTAVYCFAQPTSNNSQPVVHKVDISELVPEPPAPVASGYGRKVAPDQVFMGEDGVVYVYNKTLRNIFRWSTATRRYLPSIPLVVKPRYLAYSASNRTIYFDNGTTQIKRISVDSPTLAESAFYTSPQSISGMQTMGDFLMFSDPSGAWQSHYVVSDAGTLIDSKDWNYYSREYTWSPANNRLYFFRDDTSPNDLMYETISVTGEITDDGDSPYHGEVGTNLPIRVAADASSVLLGSGQLYDGSTLSLVATLPETHVDAAWSNGRWVTLGFGTGGTKIQKWSTDHLTLELSATVAGTPLRIFTLPGGTRLLVITSSQGYLQYTELSADDFSVIHHVDTADTPGRNVGADFNGDARTDLVWQNLTTGERAIWLMDGTTTNEVVSLGTVPVAWTIATTADFNADGQSDLVWQNLTTGERAIWLMNGTTTNEVVSLGTVPVVWTIATTGDFNADGQSDLVWQNLTTGERAIWLMNGVLMGQGVDMGTVPVEWTIATSGDFNADSKSDLVWQNLTTGEREIWLMNGVLTSEVVSLGVVPTAWAIAGAGDFNQDSRSDLIWQNLTSGERSIWLLNGISISEVINLSPVPVAWVVGQPGVKLPHTGKRVVSDFNADSRSDVLWSHSGNGERAMWMMDGTDVVSGAVIGTVPVEWAVSSTGDFDGDGKSDLFWTNTSTGDRAMWLMNGTQMAGNAFLSTVPVAWVVSGAGDFNGDGKDDVLWTNTSTGDRAMWLMDGSSVLGGGFLTTIPLEWQVRGTGDHNGDGKADILWSNADTGERAMWLMNGTELASGAVIGTVPMEWSISASGDYNGDGKADVFWTNTITGDRAIWLMDGTTMSHNAYLSQVPVEWTVSSAGDYNGDGKADVLWTNTSTGDRAMWFMNAGSVLGGGYLTNVPLQWQAQ